MAPPPGGREGVSKPPIRKVVRGCRIHSASFYTEKDYEEHLKQMPDHFACHDCVADHHDLEALKRHRLQMHPAEQELPCPGCHKVFNRLGGLMSHLEISKCSFIPTGFVEELRAQDPRSSGVLQQIASRDDFKFAGDDISSSGSVHEGPRNVLSEAVAEQAPGQEEEINLISFDDSNDDSGAFNAPWLCNETDFPTLKPVVPALKPVLNNVVNISRKRTNQRNNTPSHATTSEATHAAFRNTSYLYRDSITRLPSEPANLKSEPAPMGTPNSSTPSSQYSTWEAASFRAPTSTSVVSVTPISDWEYARSRSEADAAVARSSHHLLATPTVGAGTERNSTWNTTAVVVPSSSVLFPDAPAAVNPLAAFMKSLSVTTSDPNKDHPDHPDFQAAHYWNHICQAYKCPHPKATSCKKPLKNSSSLIAHLKSAVHMNLQEQTCSECHRIFPNTTALTQHVESQAIRCGARKLGNVGTKVEILTQVATVSGRHEDETNIYSSNNGIANRTEPFTNVGEAGRQAAEAREQNREAYWSEEKIKDHKW